MNTLSNSTNENAKWKNCVTHYLIFHCAWDFSLFVSCLWLFVYHSHYHCDQYVAGFPITSSEVG